MDQAITGAMVTTAAMDIIEDTTTIADTTAEGPHTGGATSTSSHGYSILFWECTVSTGSRAVR